MKKIALSLFVIAASGAYVLAQPGRGPEGDMLDTMLPADTQANGFLPEAPTTAAPAADAPKIPTLVESRADKGSAVSRGTAAGKSARLRAPAARAPAIAVPGPSAGLRDITPSAYIASDEPGITYGDAPARIIAVGMKNAAKGYADGVYTGPEADAYYGIIQLQALVQKGRLTALKIVQYPSDRRTSISINRQALPMLRDEAVSAQSADVDIISGATLTSRAFIQSLRGALKQAL